MHSVIQTLMRLLLFQMMLIPGTAGADLLLPVSGPITSGIGWRFDPYGSGVLTYHRGIDIAVPSGTAVRVTREGNVVHAGVNGGYGLTVIVAHAGGSRTLYGHNSAILVKLNQAVLAGDMVALSGNSGRSTGPHVHYEVLQGPQTIPFQIALSEVRTQRPGPDWELRRQSEDKIDETMDSILKNITHRVGAVPVGGK